MANIKEKTEALNKALEAISEEEMQEVAGGLSKGGKIALATASSIIGVGAATMIGLGAAGKGPLKGLLSKKTPGAATPGKTPTAGAQTAGAQTPITNYDVSGLEYGGDEDGM